MHAGGPSPHTQDASLCGVYFALVTQNKDEELRGRVKVRFPWLDGGDQDQSGWAQLSSPMAGSQYGAFTLPEVGDTVAVVFIAGDIRFPVIVGGIWSKQDPPPETNADGKNAFRFIKSRSGHRFILDDSDEVKVVLTDRSDSNHVGVGSFAKSGGGPNATEVATPPSLNGSPKEGVAASALGGTLNLFCPNGTLTLKGQNVELTASGKADVNVGSTFKMSGGTSAKLAATATTNLQGDIKIG